MSKQPLIDQLDIAIGRIIADPEVQFESLASMNAAVLDLLGVARDLRDLPAPISELGFEPTWKGKYP